jgi:hypothetical protein
MKRLVILMLGVALLAGSVAVTFARDANSSDQTGKKGKGKTKKNKKKGGEDFPSTQMNVLRKTSVFI